MSDEHKAALAEGRRQGRVVRDYLAVLDRDNRRGPRLTPEQIKERLFALADEIEAEDDVVRRLELVQRRIDLEVRLTDLGDDVDIEELERQFVEVAADYSERKGITWPAWREIGVQAPVLKAAGVKRTRRTNG